MSFNKDEIKSRISISDFLNRYGQRQQDGKKWVCPNCGSGTGKNKTSAFGHDDAKGVFKCFACSNWEGDLFTLAGKFYHLNPSSQLNQICDRLAKEFGISSSASSAQFAKMEVLKRENDAKSLTAADMERIKRDIEQARAGIDSDDAVAYLRERGISLETAKSLGVGYSSNWKHPKAQNSPETRRIILPASSNDGYTARAIDENTDPNYRISKVGSGKGLFNAEALEKSTVFVVEGQFDVLSLAECGFNAVGLASISNIDSFAQGIKKREFKGNLILMLDNDGAGMKATENLTKKLKELGVSFLVSNILKEMGAKDPNEALTTTADISILKEKLKTDVFKSSYGLDDSFDKAIFENDYKEARDESSKRKWVIENLLYTGQIGILSGPGGAGKSFLALKIYDSLTRGINPLALSPCNFNEEPKAIHDPKNVLFLTAEDDIAELGSRLKQVELDKRVNENANLSKGSMILSLVGMVEPRFLRYDQKERVSKRTLFFDKIKNIICKNKTDLLIIDPLANIGGLQDENSNTEIYILFNLLNELIKERDGEMSILLIHHLNKTDDEGSVRIRGASAIVDGVRLAMILNFDKNNLLKLAVVKSNSLTRAQKEGLNDFRLVISSQGVNFLEEELAKEIEKNKKEKKRTVLK